jgi:hypothetical protein
MVSTQSSMKQLKFYSLLGAPDKLTYISIYFFLLAPFRSNSTSLRDIFRALDSEHNSIVPFYSVSLKYLSSPVAYNLKRLSYFIIHLFFFNKNPSNTGIPFFSANEKRCSCGL